MQCNALNLLTVISAAIGLTFLGSGCGAASSEPLAPEFPVARITSPEADSNLPVAQEILITFNAADVKGISQVELTIDGEPVMVEPVNPPVNSYTASYRWRADEVGTHAIELQAFNVEQVASDPHQIFVSVVGESGSVANPPTATSTSVPNTPTPTVRPVTPTATPIGAVPASAAKTTAPVLQNGKVQITDNQGVDFDNGIVQGEADEETDFIWEGSSQQFIPRGGAFGMLLASDFTDIELNDCLTSSYNEPITGIDGSTQVTGCYITNQGYYGKFFVSEWNVRANLTVEWVTWEHKK